MEGDHFKVFCHPTITVERDFYGGLETSPVLEVATGHGTQPNRPGKTENRDWATIGCLFELGSSQKCTLQSRHVQIHRQARPKLPTQFMKFPFSFTTGREQGLTIRTTPPDSESLRAEGPTHSSGRFRKSGSPCSRDNRTVSQPSPRYPPQSNPSPYSRSALEPFHIVPSTANNDPSPMTWRRASVARRKLCSGCP